MSVRVLLQFLPSKKWDPLEYFNVTVKKERKNHVYASPDKIILKRQMLLLICFQSDLFR